MTRRCSPAICPTARYFEAAAAGARKPKSVANWILNDLQSALSAANKTIAECPITPAAFDELVNLIEEGKINSKQGKEVFAEMFASGRPATEIVKERGLEQVSDAGAIEALADEVIQANPGPAADFKAGKAHRAELSQRAGHETLQGQSQPSASRGDSAEKTFLLAELVERKSFSGEFEEIFWFFCKSERIARTGL